MTIAEEFRSRVAESELLSKFIDNIEEKDYGCVYRFDGHMEGSIYELERGRLLDMQDINIEELDIGDGFDPTKWREFRTVGDIVNRMEHDIGDIVYRIEDDIR